MWPSSSRYARRAYARPPTRNLSAFLAWGARYDSSGPGRDLYLGMPCGHTRGRPCGINRHSLPGRHAVSVPAHVAIIMDGNGRWAAQRGWPRIKGHKAGVQSVERILEAAADAGIRHLSLYAFSTENWSRPALEVGALMA